MKWMIENYLGCWLSNIQEIGLDSNILLDWILPIGFPLENYQLLFWGKANKRPLLIVIDIYEP